MVYILFGGVALELSVLVMVTKHLSKLIEQYTEKNKFYCA